jgi:intein/homing endonuclease
VVSIAFWDDPNILSGVVNPQQVPGEPVKVELGLSIIHTGLNAFAWSMNLKQLQMPISYAWMVNSNMPYDCAREITTRELLKFDPKYIFSLDSVPDYTPLIIRDPITKNIDIRPISELGSFSDISLERVDPIYPYEVFENDRWSKIKKVIRHPFTGSLRRINCQHGLIDVTKNHSIYRNNNKANLVDAIDLKIGEQLVFPRLTWERRETDRGLFFSGNEDLAWLYGFFVAEGSISSRMKDISISNKSHEKLKKAQEIMESNHNVKMTFIEDDVSKIELSHKKLLHHLYPMFYTDIREKRIPSSILNSPEKIAKSFLKGFVDGDGHITSNGSISYHNNSQTVMQGIMFLLRRFGKNFSTYVRNDKIHAISISENLRDDLWYEEHKKLFDNTLKLRKETGWGARRIGRTLGITETLVNSWIKNEFEPTRKTIPQEIKKIVDIPYVGYVYDIATETQCFSAGVGPMLVHNTDVLMPADGLIKLIQLAEANNKSVVSGLYWAKKREAFKMPAAWVKTGRNEEENKNIYSAIDIKPWLDKNALVTCDVVGSGCLLIKADIFKKLDESNPKKPFFQWGLGRKDELTGKPLPQHSEDFYLCERIKNELNIFPELATAIKCGHICLAQMRPSDGELELI